MIRFTRRGTLKNGSYVPKALGWATEFNAYFNDNYDAELHFGMELFGSNQVVWYLDTDDMATLENLNMQILQDSQYWELVEQSNDFWVDGSLRDTVVQLIG